MVIYISNDEMEKCKKIVVVGSTNVDLIARVSHLPEPGETIGDAEYCLSYGGKGANQAIAAARSGGHVSFISCLGDDAYADTLITSFVDSGIDVDYIQKCVRHSTGIAFIFVAENGIFSSDRTINEYIEDIWFKGCDEDVQNNII